MSDQTRINYQIEAMLDQRIKELEAENAELKRIIAESQKQEPEAWIVMCDGEYSHIRDTNPETFDDGQSDGEFNVTNIPLFVSPVINASKE